LKVTEAPLIVLADSLILSRRVVLGVTDDQIEVERLGKELEPGGGRITVEDSVDLFSGGVVKPSVSWENRHSSPCLQTPLRKNEQIGNLLSTPDKPLALSMALRPSCLNLHDAPFLHNPFWKKRQAWTSVAFDLLLLTPKLWGDG
jgi:hypothetical protein